MSVIFGIPVCYSSFLNEEQQLFFPTTVKIPSECSFLLANRRSFAVLGTLFICVSQRDRG